MIAFVAGATGATGRLLVEQLLDRGAAVRVVIRPQSALPPNLTGRENLTVTRAALLDLDDAELAAHVAGCDAVASCLGHNMTLQGMWGPPRRLVTEATRRLCGAIAAARPDHPDHPDQPVRFVLMNTAGNANRDLDEPVSWAQRAVVGLMRLLLPPLGDNEQAAEFLRREIGRDHPDVAWAAVRPDSLHDAEAVTPYALHPSPTRSAIFDPGRTSRRNVADVMARLMTEEELWREWRGGMPVVYDRE